MSGYRCPYCGDDCPHLEAFFEEVERRSKDIARRMAPFHLRSWHILREQMAGVSDPVLRKQMVENADMEIWRLEREAEAE